MATPDEADLDGVDQTQAGERTIRTHYIGLTCDHGTKVTGPSEEQAATATVRVTVSSTP
jgi:hypothetical protein